MAKRASSFHDRSESAASTTRNDRNFTDTQLVEQMLWRELVSDLPAPFGWSDTGDTRKCARKADPMGEPAL